jgi:hypothetical protein
MTVSHNHENRRACEGAILNPERLCISMLAELASSPFGKRAASSNQSMGVPRLAIGNFFDRLVAWSLTMGTANGHCLCLAFGASTGAVAPVVHDLVASARGGRPSAPDALAVRPRRFFWR